MIHVTVSSDTKAFRTIEIYKDTIEPQNLSFAINQSLQTGTGAFTQYQPIFTAQGFDRNVADLSKNGKDYVTVNNTTAGYTFSYLKSIFGTARLNEKKDASGTTTEYVYTFSGLPSAFMIIRTPEAKDGYPADIPALRKLAATNGWTTGVDWLNQVTLPTLGTTRMGAYEAIGGGMRRLVGVTGSPGCLPPMRNCPMGLSCPRPFCINHRTRFRHQASCPSSLARPHLKCISQKIKNAVGTFSCSAKPALYIASLTFKPSCTI